MCAEDKNTILNFICSGDIIKTNMMKGNKGNIYMIKRNVNVDLFRIIATLFVVGLHVLGQGGILRNASPGGTKYWVAWLFEICALCAVNCFALISGYVMVNKTIKSKRIIGLWFQVLFYSLGITALFFVFLPESRTIKNLIIALLPITGKQWWYISSYFVLLFFVPFLNEAINHISQQVYKRLLIVALVGICCIDCVVPMDAFVINDGYSPIWLIIVYLFGAYIRKSGLHQKITPSKSILGFFLVNILTFLSKFTIYFVTEIFLGEAKFENVFLSYISITILTSAIFLFLFCLNVKINDFASKIINILSPVTLGVYLVHVHPLVYDFILRDAFAWLVHKPLIVMILCIFIAILFIFVLCTAIELLRIQFFKLINLDKLSEIIGNKANSFIQRVLKTKIDE